MSDNHYDIIIIGSGPGGGTLAHELAATGKRILILERGGYLTREKPNWDSYAVFVESRYTSNERWLDKDGNHFQPGIHYFVGGNSKMYGAALFRFRESDFEEVLHYDGISPAWPISYADMAPHYLRAEKLYHVHGERGTDPTEPPESAPYPYPPVSHEPRIKKLFDDFQNLGHHPFPLPIGLLLNEKDWHASRCIKCNTCDGFPCLVDAKADAQIACVDPTLKSFPNVTLLTERYVERLETDPSGRVVKTVHALHVGVRETYSADIVVVSCGAINSAALLLRSANDKHPNGLANSSDVVGRHYMCHNNSGLLALSWTPNPTIFQKTMAMNDFYHGASDSKLPLGHIQMLGKTDAAMFIEEAPHTPHAALRLAAHHSIDFWLTTEDLPDPNNRVMIRKNGTIELRYTENNLEAHDKLIGKLKGILNQTGGFAKYMVKKIGLAGTAHQNGTVRFGHDPKTSALDPDCKAHDLDNLYVIDGSCFVSSAAVNPALTIAANAIRVSEKIRNRL